MEDLLEDKLTRTDSLESNDKKRVRHESDELGLDSPDVKRLRDDLFDESGHDPAIQDLDSVMKSFEDELSSTTTVKGSSETQPDLGYLLEASDDELGLPPPPPPPETICLSSEETEETVTELVRASSFSSVVGEFSGFKDHVNDLGTCDLGDELFKYSDVCLDSDDTEFFTGGLKL